MNPRAFIQIDRDPTAWRREPGFAHAPARRSYAWLWLIVGVVVGAWLW